MANVNTATHVAKTGILPSFSWSSAIAGALIALVTYVALMILGGALGLSILTFDEQINFTAASWTAGIWWIVFSTISIGFGSYIAGRLSQNISGFAGAMNGLLVWALLSVANISFTSQSVGNLASGAGKAIEKTGDAVSTGLAGLEKIDIEANLGEMIGIENLEKIEREIENIQAPEVRRLVTEEYNKLTNTMQRAAISIVRNPDQREEELQVVKDQLQSSVSRMDRILTQDKIEKIVANNSDLSQSEVSQIASNWKSELNSLANQVEQNLPQLEERVEEFGEEAATQADKVADGVSTFLAILFVLFVIGFIVSIIFGRMGARSARAWVARA
ncbi:MAG: hypothetical protein CME62_12410 [Halobacteriovoraceae bacterium]|nr:hypothetical protein [Halobacteriovoraceae bacterium]|tara:strand:- start:3034 stop:4029 length:996 start_codon:yes stop_codon:yes gene_type:complete